MELPVAAKAIWAIGLVVAYLAVPVVLVLLIRIARAARKIALYAAETHTATRGILRNLAPLGALTETQSLLGRARDGAEKTAEAAEALSVLLAKRGGVM